MRKRQNTTHKIEATPLLSGFKFWRGGEGTAYSVSTTQKSFDTNKKNSFAVLYFLTSQQSVDQITTRKQFVSQNHDLFVIKQSYLQTTANRNDELH
jgi:hypothetical protein